MIETGVSYCWLISFVRRLVTSIILFIGVACCHC